MSSPVVCAFCGLPSTESEGTFVSTLRGDVGVCVECTEFLKRAVSPERKYAREIGEEHWIAHASRDHGDTRS